VSTTTTTTTNNGNNDQQEMTTVKTTTTTDVIKVTPALRKEINAAVRSRCGANPLAEVGLRSVDGGMRGLMPNALLWPSDSDLGDHVRLANLKTINADARHPGCAELDLYITSGIGLNRELETNVCILIRDGHVVGATTNSLGIVALKERIGFPLGDWDEPAPHLLDREQAATMDDPNTGDVVTAHSRIDHLPARLLTDEQRVRDERAARIRADRKVIRSLGDSTASYTRGYRNGRALAQSLQACTGAVSVTVSDGPTTATSGRKGGAR